MGNGIFGKWFREFATLVLTQTVQAFLLAIVMTIIIACIGGSGATNDSSDENKGNANNAAGLLAVVALASFGKIELLVKNIFGVTSGFGDPSLQGARGFTAGTAMAFRGAKNISDNLGKAIQGSRMQKQGKAGLAAMANANAGKLDANGLNGITSGEGTDVQNETAAAVQDQVLKLQTLGDINALTQAIHRLTSATEQSNKTDTQSKMEKYQDMINKGQELKKTALHETIGATIGGTAGAIVGLAQGDNIMQNTLAGAGVGDTLGKAAAEHSTETKNYKREMQKLTKDMQSPQVKIDSFKKEVAQNVASGKVEDVGAYNAAAVAAINEYKQNLDKQYKAAAQSMYNAQKPASIKESRSKVKEADKSIKDQMKKIKMDVRNAQANIDQNTNAGN